jgi:hypothetical protein
VARFHGRNHKRRSFPDLLQLGGNIVGRVVDLYILNRLKRNEIHNDPGASFTRIERDRNRIRKTALPAGEEKLRHEIEWMVRFASSPFRHHLPKVYEYGTQPGNVFYEMKYYDYANLRTVIALDMNADFFLRTRWHHLFKVLLKHLWTQENSSPTAADFFEATHLHKYRSRMKEASQAAPFVADILKWPVVTINGRVHLTPDLIMDRIAADPELVKSLTPERVYLSHGDIHSNNILCGIKAKRMILLDCRGRAPDGSEYFDVAYDVAKIYHDLRSYYSLIERHYFAAFLRITRTGVRADYEFNQLELAQRFRKNYAWVEAIIDELMGGFGNLRYRADFTEAMLYLTMVPLHLRNDAEGLVCLLTGMRRLNEWLHRYHPNVYLELARGEMARDELRQWEATE